MLFCTWVNLNPQQVFFALGPRYGTLEAYEHVALKLHMFFIFHYPSKNQDFYEKPILIICLDIRYQDKNCLEQTCTD